MTEAEWLACNDDLRSMFDFLQGRGTARKYRLFAVACCWRIWRLLDAECVRALVYLGERLADGQCSDDERSDITNAALMALIWDDDEALTASKHAARAAMDTIFDPPENYDEPPLPEYARDVVATGTAWNASRSAFDAFACDQGDHASAALTDRLASERAAQCALLRDVFGNPARPAAFGAWRTATVTSLADAIYADRAFERLPILADALEDAGCTDAAILDHCRQPGEHVRGCWVVDLVLEKE